MLKHIVCPLLILLLFISCSKENLDETTIAEDEIDPKITEVDNSICGSNPRLELTSNSINFNVEAEAILHIGNTCAGGVSNMEFNYVIYKKDFDFFAYPDSERLLVVTDGAPAIGFGSDALPQAGDILLPFFMEPLFNSDDNLSMDSLFYYTDLEVTIDEASDEVGGFVKGSFSGELVNFNNSSIIETATGSFCVEIVEVCE